MNSLEVGYRQFCPMKTQTHSMAPLPVLDNARNPVLLVAKLTMHDQSFLLRVQFVQHDGYIPIWITLLFIIKRKMVTSFRMDKSEILDYYTFGSSGGSNCTIQSTAGISNPRAATSVQSSVPDSALQNWKNVVVRFVCFCLPC